MKKSSSRSLWSPVEGGYIGEHWQTDGDAVITGVVGASGEACSNTGSVSGDIRYHSGSVMDDWLVDGVTGMVIGDVESSSVAAIDGVDGAGAETAAMRGLASAPLPMR